jgi:putative hydrolase of the HAD superfamily
MNPNWLRQIALENPQVIFFDAVGTIFGVAESVGFQYAKIARRHGVVADPESLNQSFYTAFKEAGTCAFPDAAAIDIPKLEYAWWKEITRSSFKEIEFADFDAFFTELFAYFSGAEPWFIYPETRSTLDWIKQLGIPIGLVSNFDSRVYSVLKSLELDHYFQTVTISTEVGVAKPDGKIFSIALAKHDCNACDAWHVGDSQKEDYAAAIAMGLKALLVDRIT